MQNVAMKAAQDALRALGFDPGPSDGRAGPLSAGALAAFLKSHGLPFDVAAQGEAAFSLLPAVPGGATARLPWMVEALRAWRRHEVRDRAWLMDWLKRDGRTLGDPAKNPWCGDFVETSMRLALPGEPMPGDLGRNPYWARNWAFLGKPSPETYGAIVVFRRGSGGHVGFALARDATHFEVLGGNQSNAVTRARIAADRLIACRWPATFPERPAHLPWATDPSAPVSLNEA